MSSHLSAARSKRKTFNTQGRVTTICNKIVEIWSSSGVTSEHKKIHTPFSPLQLGCFFSYRQLEQQHWNTVIKVGNRNHFTIPLFKLAKCQKGPLVVQSPVRDPPQICLIINNNYCRYV